MKRLRQRLTRLVRPVPRATPSNLETERLVMLLTAHDVDHVLDVGANIGQYATALRQAGYTGRITSFEPGTAAHRQLSAAASGDAGWRVAPRMALGAASGTATLHVSNRTDMSSLLPMVETTLQALPKSVQSGDEMVEAARLDDVFDRFVGAAECVFLKLDTQGSEAAILDGASKVLHRLAGLQIELSLVPLYEGEATYLEMLRRIDAAGFDAYCFLPGYFSKRVGRQLQMDGVFFRRG